MDWSNLSSKKDSDEFLNGSFKNVGIKALRQTDFYNYDLWT